MLRRRNLLVDRIVLGITPIRDLQGIGRNLHDHPALQLTYTGTPELVGAMEAFSWAGGEIYDEQALLKARSTRGFDLHLYSVSGLPAGPDGAWLWTIFSAHHKVQYQKRP